MKRTIKMSEATNDMSIIDVYSTDKVVVGFQSQIDLNNYEYVFKYDYSDQDPAKKITLASNDLEAVLEYMNHHPKKHFYELIKDNIPVREYVDIDYVLEHVPTEDEREMMTYELVEQYLQIRNELSTASISRKDIIVLTCHRDKKISIHIICKKHGFKNNQIQKIFQMDVFRKMMEEKMNGVIDNSVYSKNRAMRLLGSSKRESEHKLIVHQPSIYSYATLKDTLITLIPYNYNSPFTYNERYCADDITIHTENAHLDEVEEKDIETFLIEHPEYKLRRGNTNIIKLDRVDKGKCISGEKIHETQDACIFRVKDTIFFKCYCAEGKAKVIGKDMSYYDSIEPEVVQSITDVYNGHVPTVEYERLVGEGEGVTVDIRTMGCGKTYSAIEYATKKGRKLVITNRVSTTEHIASEYHINHYRERNQTRTNQSVITCFNSLHHYADNLNEYETIIIDEIGSVLKATDMKDTEKATHELLNIFQHYDGKLILMDANINDKDIELIKSFLPSSRQNVRVVGGNLPTELYMNVNKMNIAKNIFDSAYMVDLLTCSHAIISTNVGVDTRNEYIISYIRKFRPDAKILHINRDTRQSIDFSTENLLTYNYIVVSPTISEGVSFDDDGFEKYTFFGFFTNESTDAATCVQQTRRWRKIKHFFITIGMNPYRQRYRYEEEYFKYLQYTNHRVEAFLNKHRVFDPEQKKHTLQVVKDDFWTIHSKNAIEKEYQKAHFLEVYIQMCVNNGFKVKCHSNLKSTEETITPEITKEVHTAYYTDMSNARLITLSEKEKMDENVQNRDKSLQLKKYNIHSCLKYEKDDRTGDADFYSKWDDHKKLSSIYNLRRLFVIQRDINHRFYQIGTTEVIQSMMETYRSNTILERNFNEQKKHVIRNKLTAFEMSFALVKYMGFQSIPQTSIVPLDIFVYHFKPFFQNLSLQTINQIRKCFYKHTYKQKDADKYSILQKDGKILFKWINSLLAEFISIKIVRVKDGYQMKFIHRGFSNCDPQKFKMFDSFETEKDQEFHHSYDEFYDDIQMIYCDHCNHHYKSNLFYTNHVHSKKHTDNLKKGIPTFKYRCDCKLGFHKQDFYLDHIVYCEEFQDKCGICEMEMKVDYEDLDESTQLEEMKKREKEWMKSHLHEHHSDIGKHACETCGKLFDDNTHLTRHINTKKTCTLVQ